MILWNRTSIAISAERDILAAEAGLIEEGHALITIKEGGIGKVKRSTAGTTEFFTGVAMGARRAFNVATMVERITGAALVTLKKAASGTIGAFRVDTGASVAVSGSAASTTNILTASASTGESTLAFDASFVGVAFDVVYNYVTASAEESNIVGDNPGAFAVEALAKVGVIYAGVVYTNKVSPVANWYASLSTVKVIASGLFTDSGSGTGTVLTNAEIVSVPTADIPYLGLRLR